MFRTAANAQCHAYFAYYFDYYGNTYFMDASSTIGSIEVSYWEFGDGSFGYGMNPVHQYAVSGTFLVKHVITTEFGCTDSIMEYINIQFCSMSIDTLITHVSTPGGSDGSIELNIYNGLTPYKYLWSTGDTSSALYNLQQGTYSVTVTDYFECRDSITVLICEPPENTLNELTISGTVYAGNAPLPYGTILIFKKHMNTVTAMKYTFILDGLYSFRSILPDTFYLYAIPHFDLNYPYVPVYFPTYMGNTIYWQNADIFYFDSTRYDADIHLESSDKMIWGNGCIYGDINYSDSAYFETGVYCQNWLVGLKAGGHDAMNIPILLLDHNNEPIRFTLSDEYGRFNFTNLKYGTYKIHAEKAGFSMIDNIVVLDSINFCDNNVNLIINQNSITSVIPMDEISVKGTGIYPNPANEFIFIHSDEPSGTVKAEIFDISGKLVLSESFCPGTNDYSMSLKDLQKGSYTICLSKKNSILTQKLIKL
ncbi:MAG: T9SS type A sorting domain-containing protein [Bacteroidota bacterium]